MNKTKAELLKENEVLYDLAVSADAHRMCDHDPKSILRDQLIMSRKYVDGVLKMLKSTKG